MRNLGLLTELRLSSNVFRELPTAIFPHSTEAGMTALEVLAVDHNPL